MIETRLEVSLFYMKEGTGRLWCTCLPFSEPIAVFVDLICIRNARDDLLRHNDKLVLTRKNQLQLWGKTHTPRGCLPRRRGRTRSVQIASWFLLVSEVHTSTSVTRKIGYAKERSVARAREVYILRPGASSVSKKLVTRTSVDVTR